MKTTYTREELIDLCGRAIVPEENWHNRDSSGIQENIGHCWALLKAGCRFVITDMNDQFGNINIEITYDGYDRFEHGEGHETTRIFSIPTPEEIEARKEEEAHRYDVLND